MRGITDYGEKIAVITETGCLFSYNELMNESNSFAAYIGNRCLVLLLCSNTIECIIGYLGCLNNRIVPMMLSDKTDHERLADIIDKYRPAFIWMLENSFQNSNQYKEIYRYKSYVLLNSGHNIVNLNNSLALLLSTSGSTGSNKFVRISYENIQANTASIIKSLNIKAEDRAVTVLPMNYTYGLSVINTHLYIGATILLTNYPIYKSVFWEFINTYEGTSFSGVPYTYEMLIKLKLFNKFPKSLKVITQAGGRLEVTNQKIINEYAEINNIAFYVMYGQTEATARIMCMRADNDRHIGSMGKFIENVSGEISDNGELIVYGKNISMGYAENYEDLEKGDENKGTLNTGDVVVMDEDGYFYWKGRMDRNKKICGHRISLDELDRIMHKNYEEFNFISNVIQDYIVINTNFEEKEKLINYISNFTNVNKTVFVINRIADFPRKENGKINYSELEADNNKLILQLKKEGNYGYAKE